MLTQKSHITTLPKKFENLLKASQSDITASSKDLPTVKGLLVETLGKSSFKGKVFIGKEE